MTGDRSGTLPYLFFVSADPGSLICLYIRSIPWISMLLPFRAVRGWARSTCGL
nr:MAG TPA: hypothetical protein [Caudoviricetes sp.]